MTVTHDQLANAIRALAMDAVEAANSGHPGMPMGMADVATVLFTQYLKFDPADPHWPDRDRFVLSAGHGSMLIYSLLYLTGYERPTIDDIKRFRQLGSPCAGHPENFELAGVETTTGPLGQGFATAVGMAIAERHLNASYGDALVDHRTWVIAGDGCLMEGINHEAVGLAGHLKLGRLIVLWDDNKITIDGSTELSTSEDVAGRYTASGWHVVRCDGHDPADTARAFDEAIADPRPSLVACRTIIGKGAPNKQGTSATHGSALGAAEVAAAREALVWTAEPFVIPEPIAAEWKRFGARGGKDRSAWQSRFEASDRKTELEAQLAGRVSSDWLKPYIDGLLANPQKVATRKASEMALEAINAAVPWTIGGSADLTGSNNTKTKALKPLTRDDYSGRYIYYGIREFGMAAAMNGLALHGGVIPYGGTFLVFSDYCRPAIRLSALQGARVVYVMTHDSIGLGEDGPTHQPIEHLTSLRLIPNLDVLRPCDTIETAECWALSLERTDGPSLLALSRQNLPQLREEAAENRCARGAYRLRAAEASRRVVLIATGSEVEIAVGVRDRLEAQGIGADVVSMPSWVRFDAQDADYRSGLLPANVLKVSIEAGTTLGWERYTGADGLRFGINGYGASAPAPDLYKHFGLTPDAIAPQILAALKN
ncbi:putative transketolase [Sphingomonas changbaiensis NBRC 104936]|uniref:Transketolase n=1 Tax=Sphingomonas changbaiensis NBRC 104936 TaxID=1219043 RepID=A0A0E9MMI7_9SPHN|nr:transketolase [Sphingomonas changbaiensis]GAO38977.1 putative transketolase [Sphingomonas changbaiensis NBRC 104936]